MKEIQITFGEDVAEKRKELRKEQLEEEWWQREQNEKKRYFREHFRYGSATVIKHSGQFFFWAISLTAEKKISFTMPGRSKP